MLRQGQPTPESARPSTSVPSRARENRLKRDIGIDYLRSSVTVAVVVHHAALAYNTFSHYNPSQYLKSTAPIVDTVRFAPLDGLVGWNDIFFMSLMFFISGLFVVPSIARKGVGRFLADRMKRLGIPFVISAILLSPIAHYPSWLLSDSASQGGFLSRFFTSDGGTAGPAWFIWVLLAFSTLIAIAYQFIPNLMKKLCWSAESAGSLVVVFLVASLLAIVPVQLFITTEDWFQLVGPVFSPATRSVFYFAWFLMGAAIGSGNPERSLSRENLRLWPLWLTFGALGYGVHGTLSAGKYLADTPPWVMKLMLATAFCFCCTFTNLGAFGLARAFFRTSWPPADHFSENAYGVYIFHYGFVIWVQFVLLPQPMPAAVKFLITFSGALLASWFLTALLRKTVARRVL
ncbi:MAG: acyltransferase [Deltaproteobacteria bacterium]|nr:acyltransferase [Deltaproteobacteria bacterium]